MTDEQITARFASWQAKTLAQAVSVCVSWVVQIADCERVEAQRYVARLLSRAPNEESEVEHGA